MKKGAWGLVCLLALLAALLLPVGALAEGTDVVATLEIDGQTTDYATGGDYDTAEAALRAAWADAQGKTATLPGLTRRARPPRCGCARACSWKTASCGCPTTSAGPPG